MGKDRKKTFPKQSKNILTPLKQFSVKAKVKPLSVEGINKWFQYLKHVLRNTFFVSSRYLFWHCFMKMTKFRNLI